MILLHLSPSCQSLEGIVGEGNVFPTQILALCVIFIMNFLFNLFNYADKLVVSISYSLLDTALHSVNKPNHDSIQQTHDCFNACAKFMIDEIANGSGAVVRATHNIESGKLAASKV
ncbi:hypothetical protein K7X08_000660 [Anisodus acutangulus]|uniref:Proline dehydrogenase n=1 Tax=Anisodus acutangulus TaxID=402998 RepID=A0A9Q1RE98_9SOLA|nr:hypothetical protein K7X08_000660 [Anisodus acutangulus]